MPIHLSPDDLRRHPKLAARIREALGESDITRDPPTPSPAAPAVPAESMPERRSIQGASYQRRRFRWAVLPLAASLVLAGWYGAGWAAAAAGLTPAPAPTAQVQDISRDKTPDKIADTPGIPAGRKPAPQQRSLAAAGPDKPQDTAPPIRVLVNGQQLAFDVPPQIVNGRTLAPMRAIFEALGAAITWHQDTQTVTANRGATFISLPIGGPRARINGSWGPLDVPATIIDGRTLVPLRFVSEALGAEVVWDGATRTVTITESLAAAPQRCFTLGAIDFRGAYIGQRCGPVSDTPGMAIPTVQEYILPNRSTEGGDEKCRRGRVVSFFCEYEPKDHDRWTQFLKAGNGDAGTGRLWVWYATGDLFRCRPTTGECTFEFRTLGPDWWHTSEVFPASALAWAREQCTPPLTGEFTSALTGRRIRVETAIRGPDGKLHRIDAILDTGGVTTSFPDAFLRRAGYTPYMGGSVGGVGTGSRQTYSYRVPRPLIRVGDKWAPTGDGYMTVKGLVGFDTVLLAPDLMVGDGITLRTEGSRWSLSFPCQI